MTFYEFIKRCLQKEAVRTEPDSNPLIQKIMEEIKNGQKKLNYARNPIKEGVLDYEKKGIKMLNKAIVLVLCFAIILTLYACGRLFTRVSAARSISRWMR